MFRKFNETPDEAKKVWFPFFVKENNTLNFRKIQPTEELREYLIGKPRNVVSIHGTKESFISEPILTKEELDYVDNHFVNKG